MVIQYPKQHSTPRGRFVSAVAGYHIEGGWEASREAIRRSLGTGFTANVERNTGIVLDELTLRQYARLEQDILDLVRYLQVVPAIVAMREATK